MTKICLFILFSFSLSVSIAAADEIKISFDHLQLSSGFKTTFVESDKTKARVFGFSLGVQLEDKLTSTLSLNIDVAANLETGSNEAIGAQAEYAPQEELNLNEAALRYRPIDSLEFAIGALNQSSLQSPLLLGGGAFAGIKETFKFSNFYFSATQAIPSNSQLERRVGAVENETPSFLLETLGYLYDSDQYKFKVEAAHYKFSNLSSNIAKVSTENGNSTSGISNSSAFNYDFEGYNLLSSFNILTKGGVVFMTTVQYLYNDKAPSGRNLGHLASIGIGTKVALFTLSSFRNESDSSVAFYNSKLYGHNNVQGQGLGFHYKHKQFDLVAKYFKTSIIEENSTQADADILFVELKRLYDF